MTADRRAQPQITAPAHAARTPVPPARPRERRRADGDQTMSPATQGARTAHRSPSRRPLWPDQTLQLQRSHGNAHVQRLLASRPTVRRPAGTAVPTQSAAIDGAVLQRAVGDGHDLTSPLFAGDPILEACFDDEARLKPPDRGPAVSKVQQALLERGFDLGPSGADGVYGPATAAAVRAFKKAEQLGFEQFGDVGPGTMRRLNELFAPSTDADLVPDEEGDASCPTAEEIGQAAEAQPAIANALVETTTPTATPDAAPGAPPRGHVTIAQAVERFKTKVNATNTEPNLNVSQKGQFFWVMQLRVVVDRELKRMQAEPTATAFATKALVAMIKIIQDKDVTALLQQLQRMANASKSPEKAAMLAMLAPPKRGPSVTEAALWAALNKTDEVPGLVDLRSLKSLRMLNDWDNQSCGFAAHMVADRLHKKGGITPQDPKAPPFSMEIASGGAMRDRRPMGTPTAVFGPGADAGVLPDGASTDPQLGDVIFQKNVSAAVVKMQQALDGGHLIHARVLSGIGYGKGGPPANPKGVPTRLKDGPAEEHSLVVIGFDPSDTFVFHDPDAGVSSSPERGFGFLFHDTASDRLGTATSPAGTPVDNDGKHKRGDKRYQVIRLETI